MAKLTAAAITQYANNVGITGDAARIATAIALAESGGNTTSHNPTWPDNSYGLWQINMIAHTKPELGISKYEDLYDPATNASAMAKISHGGTTWHPWTTYTSGKYLIYMNQVPTDGTGNGQATVADTPLSQLGTTLTDSSTWLRLGLYIGGFLLIVLALILIAGTGKIKAVAGVAKLANKVVE
jgi:hypothetical protein